MGRASTHESRTAIFEQAITLVRAECGGPISANAVARRLATSPRQLRRSFAEAGDTTFRTCLLEARMERAAELLATTSLPVAEVARRVGYSGTSQFTKAFRRTRATTPSAHRASANRPS
jgi:transcriptional regulator GlxA family with amidase domain